MKENIITKEVIRKFVQEINYKGNTGANFIDIASQNGFLVSDLGAVFLNNDNNYIWNIKGVGSLIENKENHLLILFED
jgi:hypothetical protein